MADANSQAIETLIQAMQKVSDDKIESATFDTTDIGKIEEVLDNNKYSVSITGTVYTVPSCVTDSFSTGDNVLVLSCKNNKTAKYIIGKTSAAKTGGVSVGDMLKSIYDTDSDGKVDSAENADTVGGFTVAKSVPSDAVFTDTIYVHPATHSADIIVDGTTNKAYTATEQTKLSGISIGANKAESSTTNGNIKINGIETTVYTHPQGTNPHGTTKSDVGLGNADNTADTSKNVLSATKLTTARTINGVSFDGSANIAITDSTKEPVIASGTVSQFWSGTKTWRDLATDVRAVVLTGLSTSTNAIITATDSILVALGKLQKQITDHLSDAVKHITATERTNWNTAYTNNHSHSNKNVLDATTAPYTTAEQTKLAGIATGAEVNVNSDWSATSGDAQILNKPTTISGYGITDAYTKAEIDNKVSAVYRYKGDVASYSNLPSSGQVTGDVYNVTDTGVNYAWNGTTWDDIGGTEALATASNNGLITKEDFTKLSGIATGATKNDTDANLKNRANHTGTQTASTISDFATAALTAAPAETVSSVGALVNNATAKTIPIDADMLPLMDSADSNKIKKLSWANIKSVLSSTFATLTHTHTVSSITDLTSTASELNVLDGITATVTELNYTDGVTSNIQTQLDSKLASSYYTASDILTKLKTVDGTSSGLDADLLDGLHSNAFAPVSGITSGSWQIGEKIYNVAHCLYTGTPTEILIKTGIPFISGSHMPVIHIEGYAYGLNSPIELKIGYYVYGGAHGWCGAVSMGAWQPTIKLFTYLVGSDKYTGIALIGSIYFPQFAVHVQTEMGGNYSTGWTIESNMADNTVYNMPNTDVVTVPYKSTFSQTVSLTGDVTGSATINGVSATSITATVADNSHNHTASNISNFDTEVSNSTDVTANTSARHTHSNKAVLDATTASFTTADETKLDGIAVGANNYSLPVAATSVLGGIKSGTDISIDASGNVSVVDDSHNHIISNIDGLQTALDAKLSTTLKGASSGLAELDTNGKVPSSQLPSYVDDVIEGTFATFPITGESGKIYIDTATGKTYRWSGSVYSVVSETLALGETSSTAYAGDKGKAVTDALASHKSNVSNPHGVTASQVGLGVFEATSTNIKMNGAQSVGALSTVARADHVHPVDTSRAAASHTHTVSSITDLTATAAELNVLDGITSTVTELNYTDGVTSNIQTQLNSKANSSSLATVATSGSYSDLTNKPAIPTITNTMISRANDNSAPAGSTQIDANLLDGYDSGYFANIKLSSTQPTGQRVNDFWLQIV